MKNLSVLPLENLKNKKLYHIKFDPNGSQYARWLIHSCKVEQIMVDTRVDHENGTSSYNITYSNNTLYGMEVLSKEYFDEHVSDSFIEALECLTNLVTNYFYDIEKNLLKERNSFLGFTLEKNVKNIRDDLGITDMLIDDLTSEASKMIDSESLSYSNKDLSDKLNKFSEFIMLAAPEDCRTSGADGYDCYDETIIYFNWKKNNYMFRRVVGPGSFNQLSKHDDKISINLFSLV